jgi:hypothetical protein
MVKERLSEEKRMRLFVPALLLGAAMLLPSSQSFAQSGARTAQRAPVFAYCHRQPMSGALNCSFTSFQQCLATASGDGGDCIRNPALSGPRR